MKILTKVHSKVCGLEGPTLAWRVQRMGYFLPELRKVATEIQESCEKCQMVIDVRENYFVEKENWRQQYINYLLYKQLPDDIPTSILIKQKADKYFMKDNQLYRRSFQGKAMKCLGLNEAEKVLREVHAPLWESFWWKKVIKAVSINRILLAYHGKGFHGICQML